MKKILSLSLFGSMLIWTNGCEVYHVKPTDPKAAAMADQDHDHDHEHVQDAEGHWTCPHEGGDYAHPGKCPNKWCNLDLVPLKKKR
jgi:ABC-type nickel/cobalt efflux system permease component RcnA